MLSDVVSVNELESIEGEGGRRILDDDRQALEGALQTRRQFRMLAARDAFESPFPRLACSYVNSAPP